jgi:hypothetical protein
VGIDLCDFFLSRRNSGDAQEDGKEKILTQLSNMCHKVKFPVTTKGIKKGWQVKK